MGAPCRVDGICLVRLPAEMLSNSKAVFIRMSLLHLTRHPKRGHGQSVIAFAVVSCLIREVAARNQWNLRSQFQSLRFGTKSAIGLSRDTYDIKNTDEERERNESENCDNDADGNFRFGIGTHHDECVRK